VRDDFQGVGADGACGAEDGDAFGQERQYNVNCDEDAISTRLPGMVI
jgi:hypothetical protein